MKKTILSLCLITVLSLSVIFAVGCGGDNNSSSSQQSTTSNASQVTSGQGEQSSLAGNQNSSAQDGANSSGAVVGENVAEQVWKGAFNVANFSNVTYEYVTGMKQTPDGAAQYTYQAANKIDGNVMYSNGTENYGTTNTPRVYYIHTDNDTTMEYRKSGEAWIKNTYEYDVEQLTADLIGPFNFTDYFASFTYVDGYYELTGADITFEFTEDEYTMTVTDAKVWIKDGKLLSVDVDFIQAYSFDGENINTYLSFQVTFSDYGATEVSVPQDVIDNAVQNSPSVTPGGGPSETPSEE